MEVVLDELRHSCATRRRFDELCKEIWVEVFWCSRASQRGFDNLASSGIFKTAMEPMHVSGPFRREVFGRQLHYQGRTGLYVSVSRLPDLLLVLAHRLGVNDRHNRQPIGFGIATTFKYRAFWQGSREFGYKRWFEEALGHPRAPD